MANQNFTIKKKKVDAKTGKTYWHEVGRMTVRETAKGVSAAVNLHFLDGNLVAFPVDPKPEETPAS